MGKIVQEKFEIREPLPSPAKHKWASDKSARINKAPHGLDAMLNRLPPGMDIEDQSVRAINREQMASTLGVASDATVDVTRKSLREGYDRKKMRPTDDLYTNEHVDTFYDEATVDGQIGLLERGNVLDRS